MFSWSRTLLYFTLLLPLMLSAGPMDDTDTIEAIISTDKPKPPVMVINRAKVNVAYEGEEFVIEGDKRYLTRVFPVSGNINFAPVFAPTLNWDMSSVDIRYSRRPIWSGVTPVWYPYSGFRRSVIAYPYRGASLPPGPRVSRPGQGPIGPDMPKPGPSGKSHIGPGSKGPPGKVPSGPPGKRPPKP